MPDEPPAGEPAPAVPDGPAPADVPAMPDELAPAVCSRCGVVAPTATPRPLDWMTERDPRRGLTWFCARCARDNVRSIEGKLDADWW